MTVLKMKNKTLESSCVLTLELTVADGSEEGGILIGVDKCAWDGNWETRNALLLLWTFEKGDKACFWGTEQPHQQIVPGQSHTKMNLNPLLLSIYKINSKRVRDINVKAKKTIKLIEENVDINLILWKLGLILESHK